MKALITFNDNSQQHVAGKDLHIHIDSPGSYHITDAYHNHRVLAAFANVREISLDGKSKVKKVPSARPPETLTIEVDTTKLTASIREAIIEIEDLVQQGQLVNRADVATISRTMSSEPGHVEMPNPTDDDLHDPVFNAIYDVIKSWDVNSPLHYHGYCHANGSHAKLILDALRVHPDNIATIVHRRDELLRGLDALQVGIASHDVFRLENPGAVDDYQIGVINGMRTALADIIGRPVELLSRHVPVALGSYDEPPIQLPIGETGTAYLSEHTIKTTIIEDGKTVVAGLGIGICDEMPTPIFCTCPPKRNIEARGHLSYCPAYDGPDDCAEQPSK